MKKQYIQPALMQTMATEMELPVAASIPVGNNPQDGVSGDVKESSEWDEDWGDDSW